MPNIYEMRTITGALKLVQDYGGGKRVVYLGEAPPGSLQSEGKWRIRKFNYNITGDLLEIQWADGDGNFDKVWNNRAGYTYA